LVAQVREVRQEVERLKARVVQLEHVWRGPLLLNPALAQTLSEEERRGIEGAFATLRASSDPFELTTLWPPPEIKP
ncbi:MAG: hypothetical protein ACRC1H_02365, partial [Caldilineaceae bacterium]